VHDLDRAFVEGKLREFNGDILAAVTSIQPIFNEPDYSVRLIPCSICPKPGLLIRLSDLVSRLSNEELAYFLNRVFADDTLALPFVRLPASRNHHHSVAGGLLEHSLECAEMVQHFSEFNPDMKELAVVAALLHDVGKVITLRTPEKFCLEGAVLDHGALTLEVLAPHLKKLDAINKEMAIALRYLWTWRYHRRGMAHPALTIAEAVSAVDRISSGRSIEEMTFKWRPEWQTVARAEQGKSISWRPHLNGHTASFPLKH
jgi:3'-5' exoribonuclease